MAAGLCSSRFGGVTNALIPLYAVGVFTSFTLSQLGIARRAQKLKPTDGSFRWRSAAVGAFVTFAVLLIVAVTKFTSGAWVPLLVVPSVIGCSCSSTVTTSESRRELATDGGHVRRSVRHTVVVLVGADPPGRREALRYAISLRPTHLTALYVADNEEARGRDRCAEWDGVSASRCRSRW